MKNKFVGANDPVRPSVEEITIEEGVLNEN